ncbi:MAG: hypothetical protein ACRDPA_02580, partial [Solirubrobacteraceae bacterium]
LATAPAQPWGLVQGRNRRQSGVDAHSVRRENRPLGSDPQTDLASEIAGLKASIDRAAAAAEVTLAGHQPASADDDPCCRPAAEHKELCRQLAALRERVARAECRNAGPGMLRAELATLLFFARTLQTDVDTWRSALEAQMQQLERQKTAARKEREGLADEREKLARRRDALQSTILQTAERMAKQYRGECRRTVPVVTLGEGLTVCSVSVSCPRRRFRFAKLWLVTLTRSHDVLVRRE